MMDAIGTDSKYWAPFPTRLRDLLDENHVSQRALAEFVDVKRQTISAYANGSVEPTLSKLVGIAKFFGKSIDYLVGEHECPTPDNQKIYERLGLSDEAITKLEALRHGMDDSAINAVNTLLEMDDGIELLPYIDYYLSCSFDEAYPVAGANTVDEMNPLGKMAVRSLREERPTYVEVPPVILIQGFLSEITDRLFTLRNETQKAFSEKRNRDANMRDSANES